MASQNSLIVEITDFYVKLLFASSNQGETAVTSCAVVPIAQLSEENVSQALSQAIEKQGIKTEGAKVILVLPRQLVLFRYLSLPSHNDAELEQMVELQAINNTPYAREDVSIDSVVLEKDDTGHSKVLVIIVPKDVIDRQISILSLAGIMPNIVSLSSLGLLQWYLHHESQSSSDSKGATALINLDKKSSEICICYSGKMAFSRSVRLGLDDLDESKFQDFFKQLDLTISSYRKENFGNEVDKIVLISSSIKAEVLREELQKEYEDDVEVCSAVKGVNIQKGFEWPKFVEAEDSVITPLVGLALTQGDYLINLIPSEIEEQKKSVRKRWAVIRCVVFLFMALAAIVAAFGGKPYKQEKYLSQFRGELKRSTSKVKKIERKQERLEFMKESFKKRVLFMDIIHEIYSLMPEEAALTTLKLSDNRTLVLQGFSKEGSDINDFQNSMVKSQVFSKVKLDYVNKRKTRDGDVAYFKITCLIANN